VELNHDFAVPVPIDQAWAVLTDLERIAPCMPGAQLQEVEGDEYRGVVKVKVGPITAQYRGVARIVELDPAAHRAVLRAEGRETRGQGTAAATVTAELRPEGTNTAVHLATDLEVSGRVAQFGRGVLAEVSEKLLNQFTEELERTVLGPDADGANSSPASEPVESGPRAIDAPERPPVDLLDAAGGSVLKRALPVLAAVVLLIGIWRRRRRR
jgi:carbon monoxide dehydrogenase subunit G